MPKERMVRREEMQGILAQPKVARLATSEQGQPYVVPVFFIYHQGVIYIHSSRQGRKSCFGQAQSGWNNDVGEWHRRV